ncbi:MAG: ABC transporter ATP-binding protein [Candidatus Riflebacteria bacterium]|nr:ABC transporter ATP-binding protein [Candidatus Riflebacteria bacterium]
MNKTEFAEGLIVENVSYSFNDRKLLSGVTFDLFPGECVALLGANGSGKTTLLRLLTGFFPAKTGNISWDGVHLKNISTADLAKKVSLVELIEVPFFSMTVLEMIRLGRTPHLGTWGTMGDDDEIVVQRVVKAMSLESLLNRSYQKLSLGEKQRVTLAMSLTSEPRYLLLDEPTSHLDPSYQKEVVTLIHKLSKHHKTGVLAVLHDINLARFFDRVLFLYDGEIIINGTPSQSINKEILDKVYGQGTFSLHEWQGLPVGILADERK